MKLPPPTAKMIAVLKALQSGQKVHFMPYAGRLNPRAYYYCLALRPTHCTAQVQGLLDRELVSKLRTNKYSNDHDIVLTDAGRQFTTTLRPKE